MKRSKPNLSESDALKHIRFMRVDEEQFETILRNMHVPSYRGSVSKEELKLFSHSKDVAPWLKQVGFASRENYNQNLCFYSKCVNLSPSALLDLKASESRRRRFFPAERLLNAWIEQAEKQKIVPSRISIAMCTVRSFYKYSFLPLKNVTYDYIPKPKEELDDNDLRRFRKEFDFYGKVLFDFLLSVPLRDGQFQTCPHCGEMFYPRWSNIKTFPKIEPYSPFIIKPAKGHEKRKNRKRPLKQVCYLSPSAAAGLNMLRNIKEAALNRRLRPNEFIFTHNINHAIGIIHVTPIGTMNIIGFFKKAAFKSKVHITPHYLRSWDNQTLIDLGIDPMLRNLYLGHSVAYEMNYIIHLVPKWQKTFRRAKAAEALDVCPPGLRKSMTAEQAAALGLNPKELEIFRKVLKTFEDKGFEFS